MRRYLGKTTWALLAAPIALGAAITACSQDTPYVATSRPQLDVGELGLPGTGAIEYKTYTNLWTPFHHSRVAFARNGDKVELSAFVGGRSAPAYVGELSLVGRQGDEPQPLSPLALQLDLLPKEQRTLAVGARWSSEPSAGVLQHIYENSTRKGRAFIRSARDMEVVALFDMQEAPYQVARIEYTEYIMHTKSIERGGETMRRNVVGHGMADVLMVPGADGRRGTYIPVRIAFRQPRENAGRFAGYHEAAQQSERYFVMCAVSGLNLDDAALRWAPGPRTDRPELFDRCW